MHFDYSKNEAKLIDKKLENIFGAIGWKFEPKTNHFDQVSVEFLEDFF